MLAWMLSRIERLRQEPVTVEVLEEDCRVYLARLDPPPAIGAEVLARLMLFTGQFDGEMFRMMLRFLVMMEERDAREAGMQTRPQ